MITSLLASVLFAVSAQKPIHPPFKIAWEVKDFLELVQLDQKRNLVVFHDARGHAVAFDLKTGKERWRVQPDGTDSFTTFEARDEIVEVTSQKRIVRTIDKRSGQVLKTFLRPQPNFPTIHLPHITITEDPHRTLVARDDQSGAELWTYAAQNDNHALLNFEYSTSIVQNDKLFFKSGPNVSCLDLKSGKVIFTATVYNRNDTLSLVNNVLICNGYRPMALDAFTGKKLWSSTVAFYSLGISRNSTMICSNWTGDIYSVQNNTGKINWKKNIASYDDPLYSVNSTNEGILIQNKERVSLLDWSGKTKWTASLGYWVRRITTTLPDGFLAHSQNTLVKFVPGSPDSLPKTMAKRRERAEKIFSHITRLTNEERRQFVALGDESWPLLYKALIKQLEPHPTKYDQSESNTWDLLENMAQSRHTTDLLHLLRQAKEKLNPNGDQRWVIYRYYRLLARVGNPKLTVPYFIKELKSNNDILKRQVSTYDAVLQTVFQSRLPQATAFARYVLTDPKAPTGFKSFAYFGLANMQGQKGANLIVAIRNNNRRIKPFLHLVQPTIPLSYTTKSTTKNVEPGRSSLLIYDAPIGERWLRFYDGKLGQDGALWISKWDGTNWGRAAYTGLNLGIWETFAERDAKKWFGMKSIDFLAKGWTQLIPRFDELQKDSDGDLLTDVIEKNLGTDPRRADTDGDGIPDAEDRNPLCARKAKTEDEKVIESLFEALSRFSTTPGVKLVEFPKSMKPFELLGGTGYILGSNKLPDEIAQYYISIFRINPEGGPTVIYSANHQAATITIGRQRVLGRVVPFEYSLRKFGATWIVVGVKQTGRSDCL